MKPQDWTLCGHDILLTDCAPCLRARVEALELEKEKTPRVLKDHEIAQLVNQLRDIAKEFHNHQSLRERIAHVILPVVKVQS